MTTNAASLVVVLFLSALLSFASSSPLCSSLLQSSAALWVGNEAPIAACSILDGETLSLSSLLVSSGGVIECYGSAALSVLGDATIASGGTINGTSRAVLPTDEIARPNVSGLLSPRDPATFSLLPQQLASEDLERDFLRPVSPGSPGCGSISVAGGAAIRLSVMGVLTVAGVIVASGENNENGSGGGGGGGGAIFLEAETAIWQSGSFLAADGGSGGSGNFSGGRGAYFYHLRSCISPIHRPMSPSIGPRRSPADS